MPKRHFPTHNFETIKLAFNRWRADFAPDLTRDEAVRYALGEWLAHQGYLPTERDEPAAPQDEAPEAGPGTPIGPRRGTVGEPAF